MGEGEGGGRSRFRLGGRREGRRGRFGRLVRFQSSDRSLRETGGRGRRSARRSEREEQDEDSTRFDSFTHRVVPKIGWFQPRYLDS